jgi:hypothetical protein
MMLTIILGYLGVAAPLLLGLLRAAARTAPVPTRRDTRSPRMPWRVPAR